MEINNKKKIIFMLFILWGFVFVAYTLSDPNNIKVQPATQYSSGGFKAISNLATGYFNETGKQISHIPKLVP